MTAEEAADMRAHGESDEDIAQSYTYREADAHRVLQGVRAEDQLIAICGHGISFARVVGEHRASVNTAWCQWVDEGLLCTDASRTDEAVFDENPQRVITLGEGVSDAVALEIVRAHREKRIAGLPAWGGIPFTHEHVRHVARDGQNYKVVLALEDCGSGCGSAFSVSLNRSDAGEPLRVVAAGGVFCE